MSLDSIRDSVQEVAEAISEVLNVDVTIVDHELNRIAASGKYKRFIGTKIPAKCLFERVLSEKRPLCQLREGKNHNIADENFACLQCAARSTCLELATVGYPILKDSEIIGIIGINILSEDKLNLVNENFKSTMAFLEKLSSLLVGDVIYKDIIKTLEIQHEENQHLIEGLSKGLLSIDDKGIIKYINKKAQKLLTGKISNKKYKNINEIIEEFDLQWILKGEKINDKSIRNDEILLKINPVVLKGKVVSAIIEISKKSEEVRNAYKLIGKSKVIRFQDILGQSASIQEVKELAKNISHSDSTVLLRGESGTGKELFARAIHFESLRADKPFVAINCAAIPENLLESEFFGYEGGAFTGSKREGQIGKFELASGGTIFLDEIGDLPIYLQPKILRVLQDRCFVRVGGREEVEVDVRIIAATNRNLEEMAEKGDFREDLYYRLNVIPIYLPSLSCREEDVLLITNVLINKFCTKYNIELKELSSEVKSIFKEYPWPGNIRELQNAIEYMINICTASIIEKESLPLAIKRYIGEGDIKAGSKKGEVEEIRHDLSLKERVEDYEKNLLKRLLCKHGNTAEGKNQIIKELKIDLSTLYRKLNKYDLQK